MSANPSVAVGIDVGGTKILVGYVTRSGEIVKSERFPMDRSSQAAAVASIYHAAERFLQLPWEGPQPEAIGIGVLGQVDPHQGVWVEAINIPIQTPVPIARELSERYGIPAAMDNDVHAAVLAEAVFGAGKRFRNLVYLNIGTGIALGMISDGRLIRGEANYAGEFGHMSVDPHGEDCVCGSRGCLENIASGGGIIQQAQARLADFPESSLHRYADRLNSHLVFQEALQGDPLAVQLKDRALGALGTAVVNVVNLLNPAAVVFGGGVLKDDWIIDELRDVVMRRSLPAASRSLRHFAASELNIDKVGLLGAASLAWGAVEQ